MHHFHDYQSNPLEIKQLAEFDAAIAQYTQSEQRRRRLIYLRDAAQQLKMGKAILKGFGWFMRKKAGAMMENQIKNALEYWGIHEVEIDAYVSDRDSMDSDKLIPGL